MTYYHCSPTGGLTLLELRSPKQFGKQAGVYLAALRPMALMYGVRNYEYTYGYTKDGKIVYEEYYPDALRELYKGKRASLYLCEPDEAEKTKIPNEAVSRKAVPVLAEEQIEDVYDALMEEAQRGNLVIRLYEQLSPAMKDWIEEAEAKEILERGLLDTPCPMADYMKLHYPKSWVRAREAKAREIHDV